MPNHDSSPRPQHRSEWTPQRVVDLAQQVLGAPGLNVHREELLKCSEYLLGVDRSQFDQRAVTLLLLGAQSIKMAERAPAGELRPLTAALGESSIRLNPETHQDAEASSFGLIFTIVAQAVEVAKSDSGKALELLRSARERVKTLHKTQGSMLIHVVSNATNLGFISEAATWLGEASTLVKNEVKTAETKELITQTVLQLVDRLLQQGHQNDALALLPLVPLDDKLDARDMQEFMSYLKREYPEIGTNAPRKFHQWLQSGAKILSALENMGIVAPHIVNEVAAPLFQTCGEFKKAIEAGLEVLALPPIPDDQWKRLPVDFRAWATSMLSLLKGRYGSDSPVIGLLTGGWVSSSLGQQECTNNMLALACLRVQRSLLSYTIIGIECLDFCSINTDLSHEPLSGFLSSWKATRATWYQGLISSSEAYTKSLELSLELGDRDAQARLTKQLAHHKVRLDMVKQALTGEQ